MSWFEKTTYGDNKMVLNVKNIDLKNTFRF